MPRNREHYNEYMRNYRKSHPDYMKAEVKRARLKRAELRANPEKAARLKYERAKRIVEAYEAMAVMKEDPSNER